MPWSSAASVATRSSSLEEAGWRCSTISTSLISLRAHWIAPMPISSRASPRERPRKALEAPTPRNVSVLSPMSKAK